MSFTTKDFIENLEFDYFESYSFQRKGDFELFDNLFKKSIDEKIELTNEEETIFKQLRKSGVYKTENNSIFTKNGKLNDTAELISMHEFGSDKCDILIETLKIPFKDFDAWMCGPIFRDAILFYDSKSNILAGINICFQCSNMVTLENKEILVDRTVYTKLKDFLIKLGHKIS